MPFRLSSHNPVIPRRPISFPDFDCQSTYILGTDLSDILLDQVAEMTPDEKQEVQSITTLWSHQSSDESLQS